LEREFALGARDCAGIAQARARVCVVFEGWKSAESVIGLPLFSLEMQNKPPKLGGFSIMRGANRLENPH
jgi:hypothetical protein